MPPDFNKFKKYLKAKETLVMKNLTKILKLGALSLGLFTSLIFSPKAEAIEDRTGFLLGGGAQFSYEINELEKFGGGIHLQAGHAFNNKIQLFGRSSWTYTSKFDVGFSLYDLEAVLRYYVYNNSLYLTGSAGVSYIEAEFAGLVGQSDIGFVLSAGAGYEFGLTDKLGLAPEVSFKFRSIDGFDPHTLNFGATLNYYF